VSGYTYKKLPLNTMDPWEVFQLVDRGLIFTATGIEVYIHIRNGDISFRDTAYDKKQELTDLYTRELIAEPEIDYKTKFKELEAKHAAVCAEHEELQKVHDEIKEALS